MTLVEPVFRGVQLEYALRAPARCSATHTDAPVYRGSVHRGALTAHDYARPTQGQTRARCGLPDPCSGLGIEPGCTRDEAVAKDRHYVRCTHLGNVQSGVMAGGE